MAGGKKSRAPLAQNDRAANSDNAGRMTFGPSAHKTVHSYQTIYGRDKFPGHFYQRPSHRHNNTSETRHDVQ